MNQEDSPGLKAVKKRRDKLRKFSNEIINNSKLKAVSIVIKFEHKTFNDNTGSARLYMDSVDMQFIVMEIEELINKQRIEIENQIKSYEE
tara:strand:- start:85 stop:354 length:270 start_codon:yes stop_codon:yes gene_type:complete